MAVTDNDSMNARDPCDVVGDLLDTVSDAAHWSGLSPIPQMQEAIPDEAD